MRNNVLEDAIDRMKVALALNDLPARNAIIQALLRDDDNIVYISFENDAFETMKVVGLTNQQVPMTLHRYLDDDAIVRNAPVAIVIESLSDMIMDCSVDPVNC